MSERRSGFKKKKEKEEKFEFPDIKEMEKRLMLAAETQIPEFYLRSALLAEKAEKPKFPKIRKETELVFVKNGIEAEAKKLKIKL